MKTSDPASPSSGALAGLKVIDFSRVLGVPYGTEILADHGADVIKVEPPQGDETREWGPPFAGESKNGKKLSAYYNAINRNKRGIALDLRTEEGKEVAFRLLDGADVMTENFKPGSLEKWGMGYEDVLSKRFPKLIHAHLTGFGSDGPLGGYPGYDAVAQAMSGVLSVNGSKSSGPIRVGISIVDMAAGMNLVIGILMALRERDRSGLGQSVETTLYDTGLSITHPHAANWLFSGKLPELTGNAHPNIVPYDLYPTKKGTLFLGIGNDGQFRKACTLFGAPQLADDARFKTNQDRLINREELTVELSDILMHHEAEAIAHDLLEAGVPAGPVHNIGEAWSHEQSRVREMAMDINGYKGVGTPIKLSRTPGSFHTMPPAFGGDTEAILSEHGFSQDEIVELKDKKIVFGNDV